MGEVYAAEDVKLHRQVAVKVLPASVASDPERRRRFEREAHTIAALNHPNIVTIYSIEKAVEYLFLSMELVQGRPLSDGIPAPRPPCLRVSVFEACSVPSVPSVTVSPAPSVPRVRSSISSYTARARS
jgi:serine/threonine protein kinase